MGYFLERANEGERLDYAHCLGGDSTVAICPNCYKPFTQLAQLDTGDLRLGLTRWPARLLPLIYCWRCPAASEPIRYSVSVTGTVTMDSVRLGSLECDDFPYPDYPLAFPMVPVRLVEIPKEDERDLLVARDLMLNDGAYLDFKFENDRRKSLLKPHHQLLGTPFLNEPNLNLPCHICGVPMEFLATVADDSFSSKPFVDNTGAQVVYLTCRKCFTIAAIQDCD